MWQKTLAIIILFYLFALLQNTFFAHFPLFGVVPNLVFIFFFLLVFFSRDSDGIPEAYQIILLSVAAGIILDIFSYTYIGPSIVAFIIIGFLIKKMQVALKNREDKHPFAYFLPLFIVFFLAYNLLTGVYIYFLGPDRVIALPNTKIIFSLIYNSLIVSVLFYVLKKLQGKKFSR